MRSKHYLRSLWWLTFITLGLGAAHYGFSKLLFTEQEGLKSLLVKHYGFIYLLHVLSFSLLFYAHHKMPEKTGFAFLGLSLLKIMLGVAYLWPFLQASKSPPELVLLHFMLPYFVFLAYEVAAVYHLLRKTNVAP